MNAAKTKAPERARARPAPEEWAVRAATAADAHIGRKLHTARRAVKMTQGALAEQVGMSFQQIQKYEKGTSRIAATTLLRIAQALNVPLSYFFDELTAAPGAAPQQKDDALTGLIRFAESAEGLRLLQAYLAVADHNSRRRMLELLEDLAAAGARRD